MSAKRSSTRNVVLSKAMKHVDEETRREFRERRLQALESDNYVETEIAQADEDAYNESDVSLSAICLTSPPVLMYLIWLCIGRERWRWEAETSEGESERGSCEIEMVRQAGRLTPHFSFDIAVVFCRATKVVKPLERILMDNGIVREQTNTKKSVATEAMNINGTDSDEQVEVVQMPSSSAGTKKLAAAARSTSTGSIGPREWNCGEVNYYTIAAKPSAFPARQCFCSVCGYIGNYSCTRCGSKFCSIKCNESHRETRCFKFSM